MNKYESWTKAWKISGSSAQQYFFSYDKSLHWCQATRWWTSLASPGAHIIHQHRPSWHVSNIRLIRYIYVYFLLCTYYCAAEHSSAYSNFRRMDILCPKTNVQLLTLTLPHQLQPVFHTARATEVELPLHPFSLKKLKIPAWYVFSQPWIMLYPLSKITKYAFQGKVTIIFGYKQKKWIVKDNNLLKRVF